MGLTLGLNFLHQKSFDYLCPIRVPHFNDDDENSDIAAMEERLGKNLEGSEASMNNIETESYHESQNTLDMYLFHPELLKASRYISNQVYTKTTLQNLVGEMLTKSKHKNVLMSRFDNTEEYQELLVPAHPTCRALVYLDEYHGFYEKGAIIFYDIDALYILNSNGKVTAKREDEWTETTFLVTQLESSIPGNAMVRRKDEKIFYIQVSEMDVNPQKFSIGNNDALGSEAKLVITDGTEIDVEKADQTYINKRNQTIMYIKRENKYTPKVVRARMEENEINMCISATNLDISAFTPNKEYKMVFDETTKHEKYGKIKYRIAMVYHCLRLETEDYFSSSHRIMLKKCSGEVNASDNDG